MLLSRFSKRERYIAYISVAIAAITLFDKFVFSPVMNRLENLNEGILLQEKKLERSMHILLQEDLITSEYKKYAQQIKQERSDEETLAILLSNIEKLAKKSSVSVVDMKPSPVEKSKFYKKYTVKIEAEAKIDFLTDFIYQLEESSQLLRVVEFRLSPQKRESPILKIYLTVTEVLII